MKTLLDTHVVLWWLLDSPLLSNEVKDELDAEPELFLSPVTVWEVAIKQAAGRLPGPPDLPGRIMSSGFRELPVTSSHTLCAARLPRIHGDPFDRLLIGQALVEGLTLMTRDRHISRYDAAVRMV